MTVAWDLLLTGGYMGLNVDEVAERAAVAKTTLYRRWPTKDHLAITAAVRTLPPVPVPDTGDLRRDLTEFAVSLTATLHRYGRAGDSGCASACVLAELIAAANRHPDLGEVIRAVQARRHAMAMIRLRRACEHEGLRPDIDHGILIDQICGAIYYRVLLTGAPTDRDYAERLVSAALANAFTPAGGRIDQARACRASPAAEE
jgi:AcrR family transcriptional regulator